MSAGSPVGEHEKENPMYDAWSVAGVGGGSAVLSYLAAGRKMEGTGEHTFRLSLDKGGSLLGDVRLWGSALSWFVASYVKSDNTEKVLKTASAAMLFSLVQTEAIRYRLKQSDTVAVAKQLPLMPNYSYSFGGMGADAQPAGGQRRWAANAR
jgi:hypothetical protein